MANKIETIIKTLHNYESPEISYIDLKGSKEITKWVNDYTNNNKI